MSEMIVLSTFGALVLAGTYGGQQYFVPEAGEAPVAVAERFADQKRTFEVKPTKKTCHWAETQDLTVLTATYEEEGARQDNEPDASPETYDLVIGEGCEELTAAH